MADSRYGAPDDRDLATLRASVTCEARNTYLAELFTRHQARIYPLVDLRLDRRLRKRVSPSDVLQEAFLEATNRVDAYVRNPALPPYLWIRRVIADTLYDIQRRHLGAKGRDARREARTGAGAAGPEAPSSVVAQWLAKSQPSASDAAMARERKEWLEAALESMEPLDREIIVLRAIEMLSGSEAARVLGIDPAAARQRYVRALRKLKTVLADGAEANEDGA